MSKDHQQFIRAAMFAITLGIIPINALPALAQETPSTQPAQTIDNDASLTTPVLEDKSTEAKREDANIRFQFDGIKYNDVIKRFAQMTGKPIIGEYNVPGNLTFFDAEPYNYNDALDTLNTILAAKGVMMIEDGRHLKIVKLDTINQQNIRIIHGLSNLDDIREGEVVTVALPLSFLDAKTTAKMIQPMVATYGSVIPLSRGKGLIITDRLNNIKRIRVLLNRLDQADIVEQRIVTRQLKYASASNVAKVINTLFGKTDNTRYRVQRGPDGQPIHPQNNNNTTRSSLVTATADDRTNTIIMSGAGDRLIIAQSMIDTLDVEQGQSTSSDVRVFELVNAKAVDIAKAVQAVLPKRITRENKRTTIEQDANVVGDAATNRVIVSAPVDVMPSIETIIKELDQASGLVSATRTVQLEHTQAKELRSIIQQSIGRRDASGNLVTKLAVSADLNSNTIVISGPPADINAAETLIKSLEKNSQDKVDEQTARELHIVQLTNGSAVDMAAAIKRIMKQFQGIANDKAAPVIEAEKSTNTLIITATADEWKRVSALIDQFKTKTVSTSTKIFRLKHADANQIRNIVSMAGSELDERNRRVYPLVATADRSTNSLVVTGPAEEVAMAEKLIAELDVSGATESSRRLHIVKLDAGNANAIASALTRIFRDRIQGRSTSASSFRAEADWSSNSIIIACDESDWPMVQTLLEELKANAAPQTTGVINVYPIKNAMAEEIARSLGRIYNSRNRETWRTRNIPVTISSSRDSNSVIVSAPTADQQEIAELIKSMDVKGQTALLPITMIRLTASNAETLAKRLSALVPREFRSLVSIQADATTNTILLRAPESERQMLEKMIKQLEDTSVQQVRETKLIKLKHADASALTKTLVELHGDQTNNRGRDNNEADDVIITPAPDNRTLVVDAPKNVLKQIEELAKTLDTPSASDEVQIKTFDTADSNPLEVANALRNLFRKNNRRRDRNAPVEIEPRFEADTGSNQLIVAATPEQFVEINKLIKTLKDGSTKVRHETRIFTLTHADANELVSVIREMVQQNNNQKPQNRNRRNNQQPGGKPVTRIAAVTSTNSIVTQASAEDLALIQSIISNFDRKDTGGNIEIKIVKLKNAQADSLAQAVNAVLQARDTRNNRNRNQNTPASGTRAVITAETNSNSLLVRGVPEAVEDAIQMINRLDQESQSADLQVSVFTLKNARATELSKSLGTLFRDMIRNSGRQRGRNQTSVDQSFSITADAQTNSLIVSTSRAYLPLVEQLINDLESKAEKPSRQLQYYWLTNADAFEVADQLDQLFLNRPFDESPVIYAEQSSNSLTVIASEADLKQIEQTIQKMDSSTRNNNLQVRAITITGVKAATLATALKGVYEEMSDVEVVLSNEIPTDNVEPDPSDEAPTTQPSEPAAAPAPPRRVTVVVNEEANTLIISAPRREMSAITTLAEELAGSIDKLASDVRTFKVNNADPNVVAEILTDLFFRSVTETVPSNRRNQPAQTRTTAKLTAKIIPDARTQSLIVRAKPQDMDLIESLLKTLDQTTTITSEVRVFALKNTIATEVASNLTQIFSAAQNNGTNNNNRNNRNRNNRAMIQSATSVQQMLEIQTANGVSRVDASTMVSFAANDKTNAVMVVAPSQAMQVIESMIQELDQSVAASRLPVVRLYPLKDAEPAIVAQALQQVFDAQSTQRGRQNQNINDQAIRIATDPQAKLLIISAPVDKHELVNTVIQDMDNASAQDQRTIKVYPLIHTQAGNVAQALTQTMSDGASNNRRRGANNTNAPLRISSDSTSNTLIVKASQEEHDEIARLVTQMDRPPITSLPVQTIALKNADANKLSEILKRLYTNDTGNRRNRNNAVRPAVLIEADNDAGMLLVRADEETFNTIKAMALKIDSESSTSDAPTLIPLQNAKAIDIAQALTQSYAPPRGQRVNPEDVVTVVAEPNSNSVIITANARKLDQMKQLIERLDNPNAQGPITKYMLLENARANELATALTAISGSSNNNRRGRNNNTAGQLVITADQASNALLFNGPEIDVLRMMAMATELDTAAQEVGATVQIIQLKNGRATDMAETVQDLYNQQVRTSRSSKRSVAPLAVTADERANALVISADKATFQMVSTWVKELEGMKPERGKLRILNLDNADPNEVNDAIQRIYGATSGGNPGAPRANRRNNNNQGATVSGDLVTNVLEDQRAILIEASDEEFEAILELVKTLEAAAQNNRRIVKIYSLKHAPNTRVAQALNTAYAEIARGGTDNEKITVTALPDTDAIVVTAAKPKFEEIEKLIEQLDKADVARDSVVKVYPLKNAVASEIKPLIDNMLEQLIKNKPGLTVSVSADDRARVIIVTAPEEVFTDIASLVQRLDNLPNYAEAEIRVFQLQRADANNLAEVLKTMLRPSNSNEVTPQARALQEQVRRINIGLTAAGKQPLPTLDLSKPIQVTADPAADGSNTLIVSSTPDNLTAMAMIISMLDQSPIADNVTVEIFHLKNADASTVSDILNSIFDQGAELSGRDGSTTDGKGEPDNNDGKALVNTTNVTADTRTNAVIVSGSKEALTLARALLSDLDRKEARFMTEVKVFKLQHADPEALAPLLQAVFAEGQPVPGSEGLSTQVTRLRMHQRARNAVESDLPKIRPALSIQADAASRSLVIAALDDIMPIIQNTIKMLDIPEASGIRQVRIFPLEHANASTLQSIFTDLYAGAANNDRPEDRPNITTDPRTNSLIITADEAMFAVIMAMIKTLDTKTPIDLREIKIIRLENAQAASMAGTLQQMMDERVKRREALGIDDAESLKVIILPDERTNSLLVGGDQEGFELVQVLASKLDSQSPAFKGRIQIKALTNANAGSLSTTLNNLFTERYNAIADENQRREKPVILPDLRINSLLISANKDDTAVIENLMKKLDVEQLDPAVQLVVLPITFNDASTLATSLQTIFNARLQSMTVEGQTPSPQDRVDITTDALTNSLIISAGKENLALIRGLVKQVDIEPGMESGVIRLYPLKNADATRVSETLKGLIDQGLYKPGITSAGSEALQAAREQVALAVDTRTNVLIISASRENYAIFEQIISALDNKDAMSVYNTVQIIPIKHADATRVATLLTDFFNTKREAEITAGATDKALPVTIIPDARTNTLLVAGGPEHMQSMRDMLSKLDSAEIKSATNFGIYILKNATATSMQPMLQTLFDQRVSRGDTQDKVTILADARRNAIIVGAAAEDLNVAEMLINRMDTPGAASTQNIQAFKLSKADASSIVETIKELFASDSTASGEINLTADERSNSIIAVAGATDMARIQDLIKKLDTDEVARITEIRVYTLKNANAVTMAEILNNAINTKATSLSGGSENRDELMQFITRDKDGKELINSALKEGALFVPDARTNTLVVSAPLTSIPLLTRLITSLDETAPRTGEIRVFRLQNADAAQMSQVLVDLFKLEAGEDEDNAIRYTLVEGQAVDNANPNKGQASNGTAEKSVLTVTVDARTNSLLVGGTEHYIQLAGTIIRELDASPGQERRTHVYRLRNAQADTVEETIRRFLDQEKQRLVDALGQDKIGAAQRMLDQEVAIVADPNTNTLLLSASPRYFGTVAGMIEELDKAPPQVLIQVILAEILLDDDLDFGFEWSFEKTIDDVDSLVQTSLDVAQNFAQSGGLGVTITSGDFSMQLQALKTQNKLEVLSRPQILAMDNQEATINVGQRVPIITNSRVTDNDNVINTISYEQVGVQLTVTPRINPDGFVRMEIRPEISTFEESTITISDNVNAIIFNNRSAETTVTVQNGHTVVLGGLISSFDQKTVSKVPLLGDIPGLGELFKKTEVDRDRRELLIVLTPTVISNQSDADDITNQAINRQNLIRRMEPPQLYDDELQETFKTLPRQAEPEQKTDWKQNQKQTPQEDSQRRPRFIRIDPDGNVQEIDNMNDTE